MRERREKKAALGARVDNALSVFFPKFALKRTAARYAREQLLSAAGAYRGADKNRLTNSWRVSSGSADQDILPDLKVLRERSRDLNRNNDTASGISETLVNNVVGRGIIPQSRIDAEAVGLTRTQAEDFQKRAEEAWSRWVGTADIAEKLDFYGLQALAERKIAEDGDIIALPVMLPVQDMRPYTLSVDMVEADRLMTPGSERTNKKIRAGVEIGSKGQPVRYFIKKTHPGNVTVGERGTTDINGFHVVNARNRRTGRKNAFHIFDQKRPGQTRGVPIFAPVLKKFNDLDDYIEAEIVAARVAACFAVFIKKGDPLGAAAATSTTNADGKRIEGIEPGMFEYLLPGESVEFANPNKPGGNFDPFVIRILRGIASGVGLSYEAVARDYSRVNFSSARAAILEDRKAYRVKQSRQIRTFCQPFYERLMWEAFLMGDLGEVPFADFPHEMTRVEWNPPGWEWVDPVKEVKASQIALSENMTTLADELAKQGRNWEDVVRQRAREVALLDELGLSSGDSEPLSITDDEGETIEFAGNMSRGRRVLVAGG